MPFQIKSKSFFLTYPQCPAPKQVVADMLATKGTVLKGLVAQEKHEDGNPHLHVYVKYEYEVRTRDPHYFDFIYEDKEYHGKYETAKSALKSIKYVSKEDPEPLQIGDMDYKHEISARESHQRVLGKRLRDGESLVALIEEYPELIFKYNPLKSNVENYRLDKARVRSTCTGFIPNTWGLVLPILSEKKKHYWFWSDQPNLGKTTFLKSIDAQFRASWFTKAETFQSVYIDSQFILIDEYTTADIKGTTLNSMCDGTYQYPLKGGKPPMCDSIILCCGNKDPQILYPNYWQYLEARFTVINLGVL